MKLINKEFIPLAANGWGFGEILTARGEVVAPRLRSGDTGGPNGTNNPFAPKRLNAALEAFRRLPTDKRTAGVEHVPDSWKGKALASPPADGLILKQYNRGFHRDAEGRLHPDGQVLQHDSLWMTKAEWQSLVPDRPKAGESTTVPPFLVSRFGVHHGSAFGANGVRISPTPKPTLTLTVEDASPEQLRLRLKGSLQTSDCQGSLKVAVVDYQVTGCLEYDVKRKRFRRFDMVAVGDVSGTASPPPKGRTLVVVMLFGLSPGETPWQRTPPFSGGGQGAYFKAGPYFE